MPYPVEGAEYEATLEESRRRGAGHGPQPCLDDAGDPPSVHDPHPLLPGTDVLCLIEPKSSDTRFSQGTKTIGESLGKGHGPTLQRMKRRPLRVAEPPRSITGGRVWIGQAESER